MYVKENEMTNSEEMTNINFAELFASQDKINIELQAQIDNLTSAIYELRNGLAQAKEFNQEKERREKFPHAPVSMAQILNGSKF
jgi:hypothetical protein